MPSFTASLSSISGGFAFLSHLVVCDNSSQSSFSAVTNPHAVLNFPCLSLCSSPKRPSFFVPKVTVSSGTVRTDGAQETVSSDDTRYARRSADWKAAKVYKERGLIFEGRVESFNSGGLLIRFYSLLGFLPYPHLSPSHSYREQKRPIQEVAKDLVGSVLPVKVIETDEENRKLIFSEKEAVWSKFSHQISVGDVFYAKVGTVEDYGAFMHLQLQDGCCHLTGLLHISEVSWDLVQDVRDVLTEGDEVRVKVTNIDRGKCRITLSMKQLEEDPLLETLEKVIPQDGSAAPDSLDDNYKIEPLPGLETIFEELLQEDGINDVKISRQGFEKRVVSQDLQLWLSNVPPTGDQFTLLARAGRQVQEIQLFTSLDQEGVKRALQRVLERVP